MTTEIPETDSKHGMRAWKLFATAIGVVLPTANVLEYLKAHLRKYVSFSFSKLIHFTCLPYQIYA